MPLRAAIAGTGLSAESTLVRRSWLEPTWPVSPPPHQIPHGTQPPPEVPRQVVVPAAVVTQDNVEEYEQYAFD
jgi:hypothetical protein